MPGRFLDVASGNQQPHFTTIARFRRDHEVALKTSVTAVSVNPQGLGSCAALGRGSGFAQRHGVPRDPASPHRGGRSYAGGGGGRRRPALRTDLVLAARSGRGRGGLLLGRT